MRTVDFANSKDISYIKKRSILNNHQIDYKINNKEILIARGESTPVGLLIVDLLWNHIPFISYIFVDEKNRKNGVGKSLLYFLEDYLIENNRLMLFSSSMENAVEAQNWHKKMGFKDSGIIHSINEKGIGEVFFRKELQS